MENNLRGNHWIVMGRENESTEAKMRRMSADRERKRLARTFETAEMKEKRREADKIRKRLMRGLETSEAKKLRREAEKERRRAQLATSKVDTSGMDISATNSGYVASSSISVKPTTASGMQYCGEAMIGQQYQQSPFLNPYAVPMECHPPTCVAMDFVNSQAIAMEFAPAQFTKQELVLPMLMQPGRQYLLPASSSGSGVYGYGNFASNAQLCQYQYLKPLIATSYHKEPTAHHSTREVQKQI